MVVIGIDPDALCEGGAVHDPVGELLYVFAPVVVGRVGTDVREGGTAVLIVSLLQHHCHSQTSLVDSCQLPKPGVSHQSPPAQERRNFREHSTAEDLLP